jgi:hypothetical protein
MTDIHQITNQSVEIPGTEIKAHEDMNQISLYNNNIYFICCFSCNIY